MHHPTRLTKLLESIDPTTHLIRLIEHHPPTVQILTQLEEKMRKLQTKAEKKVSESKRRIANKEAQFSWSTSGMDFEHKLAKARAELQKGDVRLDVVFNPKQGVKNPTRDEMLQHIQGVVDALADVSGEWRERDFRRGSAKVFLQSTVQKNTKALPTQDEIQELAREERKRVERQVQKLKQKHGDQDITVSHSLFYEIKIQISIPSRSSYTCSNTSTNFF
jgi:translation initiation factor IF-3